MCIGIHYLLMKCPMFFDSAGLRHSSTEILEWNPGA
jgi:hypothetical protein